MISFIQKAPSIELAKLSGIATICFSLIILAVVLIVRFVRELRDRHEKSFQEDWKSLFAGTISGLVPQDVPAVPHKYAMSFFRLWTHFQESLRGETREDLCRVLHDAGGKRIALKWLYGFSMRKKLMAVVILGYLKEKSTFHYMKKLVMKRCSLLSLVAARALLQIDPGVGLPFLMPFITNRTDWSTEFMKNILKEMPQNLLIDNVRPIIERTPDVNIPRLISYLALCPYEDSVPIVRNLIQRERSPEVIIACIDYFKNPQDICYIKKFIDHPAWSVRRGVAGALGQVGTTGELGDLRCLLADQEWQVRYQAAQSLLRFPFADKKLLSGLMEDDDNPQVRAILEQVSAEEAIRS